MSARDAKYSFGRLIDLAGSEPVIVEKHGRPVVVVLSVEEYEWLRSATSGRFPDRSGLRGDHQRIVGVGKKHE
jgi:prevent-host-death family protein